MKKFSALIFLTVFLGAVGVLNVAAQKTQTTPQAKDLFTQYNEENRTTPGRPGAKVSILLKRGSQPERLVSPNSVFYSGDKIKLILDINFNGYAAILNEGSTGKPNLLFPYLDGSEMVSHRVSPNVGTKLPRGTAWIVFDQNSGTEKITVIFSKSPVVEMESYENLSAPDTSANSSYRVSSSPSDIDRFLAELNSKSKRLSKDLSVQNESDAAYYVNLRNDPNGQTIFTFSLIHK